MLFPSQILKNACISQDCNNYVKSCKECSTSKKPHLQPKAPLGQYHAGIPMERIHIDILGLFIESARGIRYIVMMIDQFTKWLECYAIPNQGAEQVATSLVEGFIARMGCPLQIHSDQGRNFMSYLFNRLCKLLEISKTRSTPYRPCANGQIENNTVTVVYPLLHKQCAFPATLGSTLAAYCWGHQGDRQDLQPTK